MQRAELVLSPSMKWSCHQPWWLKNVFLKLAQNKLKQFWQGKKKSFYKSSSSKKFNLKCSTFLKLIWKQSNRSLVLFSRSIFPTARYFKSVKIFKIACHKIITLSIGIFTKQKYSRRLLKGVIGSLNCFAKMKHVSVIIRSVQTLNTHTHVLHWNESLHWHLPCCNASRTKIIQEWTPKRAAVVVLSLR